MQASIPQKRLDSSDSLTSISEGRRRVLIEQVTPEIDAGRYAIKRTVGERVVVEADLFADGHDTLAARVLYRPEPDTAWREVALKPIGNDRWRGEFTVSQLGQYHYTVEGWVDPFLTWKRGLQKKVEANQETALDLLIGAQLITETLPRAEARDAEILKPWIARLKGTDPAHLRESALAALDPPLTELMTRYPDRRWATRYERELNVVVDPVLARYGAWYEMFPRSCASEPGRHGTFRDCEQQLSRIAEMGFEILYFPPIHPIGRTLRKGKNNCTQCEPGEPGSPWAIGAAEGGHKSVHPELGTLEDFRHLVAKARALRIEIALDIAFQCSPDHPYVREHPEWFRQRPDGSIQYAENPPKKYQDIYPFDFETEHWRELWRELKSIFEFWMEQGVRVFRVDNPHTKALPFWEWCLTELKKARPDLIFLAEAFTRPKVMYALAKLGFTQSYNYFPWRNSKDELTEYFTALTRTEVAEFFRPNLWPNTPDILTEFLQHGGRPAFMIRLILAATLGASYGLYGPAFELLEDQPREPGSEEYLNSEKYEIRHWDHKAPHSLQPLMARINQVRREHPALQSNHRLRFHFVDNPHLLAYTKSTDDGAETILTVVNLDPRHVHRGWLELSLEELQLDTRQTYQMHDLLTGARFLWRGHKNYVELDPQFVPAHIFRLRQRVRSEHDFDYFM